MPAVVGIRKEDKNPWEARAPFTPDHVRILMEEHKVSVLVERSTIRVYSDDSYAQAGASIADDLADCPVVFGIKEMPCEAFRRGGVYVFFSHTTKGQSYNMPMLKRIIDTGCTLIDYELIADERGRRLIFFGRFAGLAGMVDALWSLGLRLNAEGYTHNPFAGIRQTLQYKNIAAAKEAVAAAGQKIATDGLPPDLSPLVVGFAGYGNVAKGAQEIFDLLPHEETAPEKLAALFENPARNGKTLYKVVFKEEHTAQRRDGGPFKLQDYYDNPEEYEGALSRHLPFLSVLMNCIYWESRYPRLVTKEDLRFLFASDTPRLRVVGDISCDLNGAIEFTVKHTDSGEPTYVFDPLTGTVSPGVEGGGVVVLAVDNLPCELPREASHDFGEVLLKFAPAIARADFSVPTDKLALPGPVKNAIIVHNGRFTERFEHLAKHLPK